MATSHQHTGKRAWPAAAILAGAAGATVLMAGCGSATSGTGANSPAAPSSSSSTSGSALPCGTITSLRLALANLTHVKPTARASGQIAADLISIKANVAALKTTATAYGAQAGSLDQAIDRVGSAARAAVSHPSSASASALGSALGGVKTSAQPMIAEMKAACPGS
jgi:hypothetical protein